MIFGKRFIFCKYLKIEKQIENNQLYLFLQSSRSYSRRGYSVPRFYDDTYVPRYTPHRQFLGKTLLKIELYTSYIIVYFTILYYLIVGLSSYQIFNMVIIKSKFNSQSRCLLKYMELELLNC